METKQTWTKEVIAEVEAVVARLVEVQETRKLNDRRFVTEFPDLGSAKTWRQRLVAREYGQLNAERTLDRMRRLNRILNGDRAEAVFYRDLPFAQEFIARVEMLERQRSDRRILPVLAPNGCGKTSMAQWLVEQSRTTRTYVRMMPAWKNRELHIANGIARALGADGQATNAAEAEGTLVSVLSGQTRTIFIDQAHEGGPALMHLMRALVDETPTRFVYLGYSTAYRRVMAANTDALIEAQAFMGRCIKPVFQAYANGVTVRDVITYLVRRAALAPTAAAGIAPTVTPVLSRHTNLRLLDDAIEAALCASEDDEAPADRIVAEVYRLAGLDPSREVAGREAA